MDPDQVIEQIRRQRGRDVPEWTWLSQIDPEYMDAYNRIIQKAFGYYADREDYPDTLSAKMKELISIAVLAGQRDVDLLRAHLKRAMDLGATDHEILEALQTSMALTGGPALYLGLGLLTKLHKERGEMER